MNWKNRVLHVMLGPLLLIGCYEEVGGPAPTIFGRYSLRTVDGEAVPVILTDIPNFKVEIMTGTIFLNADNTFTDSTEIRRTDGQVARIVTDVAHGSFVHNGATIDLNSTRGEHYSMTLADRTLTQNLGGNILLYRR